MLMLIIGNVDAVWIPSLWVLLSPGLLVVKCLVFRPSRVLMNIICLPSEERVLYAVSCALHPSHRSVQSSALLGGAWAELIHFCFQSYNLGVGGQLLPP